MQVPEEEPAGQRLRADRGAQGEVGLGAGPGKECTIACTYCHRRKVCRGLPERRGRAFSCHLQSHGPGETWGYQDACYSDNHYSPEHTLCEAQSASPASLH